MMKKRERERERESATEKQASKSSCRFISVVVLLLVSNSFYWGHSHTLNVTFGDDSPVFGNDDRSSGAKKIEVAGSSSLSSALSCDNRGEDDNSSTELGFLHIPKTGGSAIEYAALNQAKKKWGWNAWNDRKKHNDLKYTSEKYHNIYHHIPPSDLSGLTNLSLAPYKGQDLFSVIRNPFTRVVSEVLYMCGFKHHIPAKMQCLNKAAVNMRLQETLTQVLSSTMVPGALATLMKDGNHYMPQWHFFYNRFTGERQTRYLLHFENLAEDFDDLMDTFSLNITLNTALPRDLTRRTNYTEINRHLFHSVKDLHETTKILIVELYRMDFELGGYSLNASDTGLFSPLRNVYSSSLFAASSASTANDGSKTSRNFWELPCQMQIDKRS
eukprot:CAMPEP_0181119292 /NCGR_PEP_ID=MMETSP1071-20121207/23530_1 /TAXON_ID=35127 /ORGANISM="Thalassiosira sp., Strain NH16" /LENGTH=384 /DNA_ID=CAMNT_0023203841 /DNA_START=113 /DNA_END=1268 /DNA_ORIENTATION=+